MLRYKARAFGFLVFTLAFGIAPTRPLKVDNTYTYKQSGFSWRVFINEDPQTLGQIKCVEYRLHPTFPNPVQRRCSAADQFGLEAEGWGEFTILVKIEWRDGKVTKQSYELDLHSPSRRRH